MKAVRVHNMQIMNIDVVVILDASKDTFIGSLTEWCTNLDDEKDVGKMLNVNLLVL